MLENYMLLYFLDALFLAIQSYQAFYVPIFDVWIKSLYSLKRRRLTGIGTPIIKLRRSDDRLIFLRGIPLPFGRCFLVNRSPEYVLGLINEPGNAKLCQWIKSLFIRAMAGHRETHMQIWNRFVKNGPIYGAQGVNPQSQTHKVYSQKYKKGLYVHKL